MTNANAKPRPISDEDTDNDGAASKKKASAAKKVSPPKPKVVPKKSATAKPVLKGSSGLSKSKAFVDTESESELEDAKQASKHSASSKSKSAVKVASKSTKKPPVKKGKTKAGTTSESEDTDTSLIRDINKGSPSPPTLTPQTKKVTMHCIAMKCKVFVSFNYNFLCFMILENDWKLQVNWQEGWQQQCFQILQAGPGPVLFILQQTETQNQDLERGESEELQHSLHIGRQ